MSAISGFYDTLRMILGDRDPSGIVEYPDADLLTAVKTVFLLGRGPDGYAVSGDAVTPDVAAGDAWAQICYHATLLLVGGEDGANSYRTRALSVTDGGHRKRDLLQELRQWIYAIESGGVVFVTSQDFTAAVHNLVSTPGAYVRGTITSMPDQVTL